MCAYDTSNEADKACLQTTKELWWPPCYLDIVNFAKTGETTSDDAIKTDLTYNLKLATHGSNACTKDQAIVNFKNAQGTTSFVHWLNAGDMATAMEDDGFTYTVSTQPGIAASAFVEFYDYRSVANQTKTAEGYVGTD